MSERNEIQLYQKILSNTPVGEIVIIWSIDTRFLIEEIILSDSENTASKKAKEKYPDSSINKKSPKKLKRIIKEFENYFNEKGAHFSINYLNMDKLTPFQKKVLIAEFNTKKGTVNTYASLAESLGNPKAYRAVGSALSKNPFPIIIPCHRTVKSDRTLGGFGGFSGGLISKQILLELEGIEIKQKRVVSKSHIISLDKKKQTNLNMYYNKK